MESVHSVGDSMKNFTRSIDAVATKVHGAAEANKEQIAQVTNWVTVIVELFNKNKKNKNGGMRNE